MTYVAYLCNKLTLTITMFYNVYRKEKRREWSPSEILNQEATSKKYVLLVLNTPVALDFQRQFILNLWQKAVVRVTVDGGTNRWLKWLKLNNCEQQSGVAPDLITGDMDSLHEDVLQYFSKKNKNLQVVKTPDQDETDFTKALRETQVYIETRNLMVDTAIVLVDTSGRLDQIIANINTLFKVRDYFPKVDVVLLASDSLTWLLSEDTVHTIHIPLSLRQNNEWCSLIPIGGPCTATSTGLKWNLNNTLLEFGKLVSTSNTYNGDPVVTIQTDRPLLWSMGIQNML